MGENRRLSWQDLEGKGAEFIQSLGLEHWDRVCAVCGREKYWDAYYPNILKQWRSRAYCIDCCRLTKAERRKMMADREQEDLKLQCTRCHGEFDAKCFRPDPENKKRKRQYWCLACEALYAKERRAKRKLQKSSDDLIGFLKMIEQRNADASVNSRSEVGQFVEEKSVSSSENVGQERRSD